MRENKNATLYKVFKSICYDIFDTNEESVLRFRDIVKEFSDREFSANSYGFYLIHKEIMRDDDLRKLCSNEEIYELFEVIEGQADQYVIEKGLSKFELLNTHEKLTIDSMVMSLISATKDTEVLMTDLEGRILNQYTMNIPDGELPISDIDNFKNIIKAKITLGLIGNGCMMLISSKKPGCAPEIAGVRFNPISPNKMNPIEALYEDELQSLLSEGGVTRTDIDNILKPQYPDTLFGEYYELVDYDIRIFKIPELQSNLIKYIPKNN